MSEKVKISGSSILLPCVIFMNTKVFISIDLLTSDPDFFNIKVLAYIIFLIQGMFYFPPTKLPVSGSMSSVQI